MSRSGGSRGARAVLILGSALLVLGVFIAIASQPVTNTDFGFVAGQASGYSIDANGNIINRPWFLSPTVGGVLLGAGVALAVGVGGYVLGSRRRR